MSLLLNLADAVAPSWANGPGARAVLYVQGCSIHCPGCHNLHTWDPRPLHLREPAAVMNWYRSHVSLRGITLSGGEPFEQAAALAEISRQVRALGGDVIAFSGYSYEALRDEVRPGSRSLLDVVDLLIDGPFLSARRTAEPLRGSENQRLIHLSTRIAPEELQQLPRSEWLGRGSSVHITGFQIHRLASIGRVGLSSCAERVQHEHSGPGAANPSEQPAGR